MWNLDCNDELSKSVDYGDVHTRYALGSSVHPSKD